MSKKISLLFCVALVLLFLLSSCAGARSDGSDYLGYQSDIGSCEGTALYNGKEYGIVFTPDGAGPTVEITAPESLAGYRFIGQSDGCLLKYGDFSMLCPKTELFETICSFSERGKFHRRPHRKGIGREAYGRKLLGRHYRLSLLLG